LLHAEADQIVIITWTVQAESSDPQRRAISWAKALTRSRSQVDLSSKDSIQHKKYLSNSKQNYSIKQISCHPERDQNFAEEQ